MYTTNNIVNELFFFNSEEFEAHICELYSNVEEGDLYELDYPISEDMGDEFQELYREMMAEIEYEHRLLAEWD